jgi:putative amide transporter protein
MLLGVMLLYVGAVLCVNGIWLVGQARAAERLRTAPAGDAAAAVEAHPAFIQGREITVLNIFTGFVGVATATTLIVYGQIKGDLASVRGGGFILLFAFTYLWVAFNGYLNAGGHAFGWYCLFVAVTAVAAAVYTFRDAAGETAAIWLGIDWIAWAVLWFLFFVLLTLERPIGRLTGYLAILEGIGTAWVFGFLLLQGTLEF